MSTRNMAPRNNEEGEVGVVGKVWKASRAKIIEATSKMTAPTVEATSKMTAPTVEAGDKSKNVATTEFVKNRENMVVNPFLLQRNTTYKVGDMVKVPKLGEQYVLECTQAGTTGNTEPNLSTVSGWREVNDGSAKFRVVDRRLKAMIDILYPIGIVVTTATDDTLKPGEEDGLATWEEIAQDKVLQGAESGAGQTIEAGLPNVTGSIMTGDGNSGVTSVFGAGGKHNGALYVDRDKNFSNDAYAASAGTGNNAFGFSFDASKSNNIYGKSETVQPPAYKVHFWKRIK